MSSLFSIFDVNSWFSLPLNWFSVLVVSFYLVPMFWISLSPMQLIFKKLFDLAYSEVKAILQPLVVPGGSLILMSLLWLIISVNFMGLIPYVFTNTSHFSFSLTLALPLWLGGWLMGWVFTFFMSSAHLVPMGTPIPLIPLMVLIELISSIIRPLTLCVRLTANMIAGHLLLALLANYMVESSYIYFSIIFFSMLLLLILECAVAVIQSFVFTVLSTLYVDEVNSAKLM